MFSILESVAFDMGYAGSNGLEPQSWVNGNGTSYIYFGSGEFDGQGSGHDYLGTVSGQFFSVPMLLLLFSLLIWRGFGLCFDLEGIVLTCRGQSMIIVESRTRVAFE